MINKIFAPILNILFPPKCVFCRKFAGSSLPICHSCKPTTNKDICHVCGKAYSTCSCSFYFDKLIAPYPYSGNYRSAALRLKTYPDQNIIMAFASEMQDFLGDTDFNYIVAVPTNKEKLKARGYNQAELLAQEIGKLSKKPVKKSVLTRTATSLTQHSLTRLQREENAFNSYVVGNNSGDIFGATIVLVDDIFTTGATLNACASVLKSHGAVKIIGLCATFTAEKRDYNAK